MLTTNLNPGLSSPYMSQARGHGHSTVTSPKERLSGYPKKKDPLLQVMASICGMLILAPLYENLVHCNLQVMRTNVSHSQGGIFPMPSAPEQPSYQVSLPSSNSWNLDVDSFSYRCAALVLN